MRDIGENEMKLQRAAKRFDELRLDTAVSGHAATDFRSTIDAVRQLECRAAETKKKTERDIERQDRSRPAIQVKLPVLPSTADELKQKIVLHNVRSVHSGLTQIYAQLAIQDTLSK